MKTIRPKTLIVAVNVVWTATMAFLIFVVGPIWASYERQARRIARTERLRAQESEPTAKPSSDSAPRQAGATFVPWRRELVVASHLCGVEIPFLAAVIGRESDWDAEAVSSSGAVGWMQLMPATARQMGLRVDARVDERFDPQKNAIAGACFLRTMLDRFGGDRHRALVAYHRGPNGGTSAKSREYATDIIEAEAQ